MHNDKFDNKFDGNYKKTEEEDKQKQLAKQRAINNKLLVDYVCKNKPFLTRLNTIKTVSHFDNFNLSLSYVKIIANSFEKLEKYPNVSYLVASKLQKMPEYTNNLTETVDILKLISSNEVLLCIDNIAKSNLLVNNFVHQFLTIVSEKEKDLTSQLVNCYLPFSSNSELIYNAINWVWGAYKFKGSKNNEYIREVLSILYNLKDDLLHYSSDKSDKLKTDFFNQIIVNYISNTIRKGKFTNRNFEDISYFVTNYKLISTWLYNNYELINTEKHTILDVVKLYKKSNENS